MEDGLIARHGWAALLNLLQMKGLITDDEARAIVSSAHTGAANSARWSHILRDASHSAQSGYGATGILNDPKL